MSNFLPFLASSLPSVHVTKLFFGDFLIGTFVMFFHDTKSLVGPKNSQDEWYIVS